NGTNLSSFFPLDIQKKENIFIYAGAIGVANDVGFILQAARIVGGEWWIYGDGSQKKSLMQEASALNENLGYECVKFFNPVPKNQLNDILNRANVGVSVFANYSVLEATAANKFYDYLAAGLPVLTNYRGWQAEVIEKYQCGYAAEQGDLEDFIYGAKLLAASPVCLNARRAAVENFDRKVLARKALDILNVFVN
ncbi:MAG: glycosyltransferase, partial [Bacteroidia bacterium]|nr:glycosyltransferase [Bacteroidia bacterium]